MSAPFSKVLVANRGEIALRVLRGAKALGYRTVAVHSAADAGAPHVAAADEAVCIGPAPVGESYLSIPRLLEAARATGTPVVLHGKERVMTQGESSGSNSLVLSELQAIGRLLRTMPMLTRDMVQIAMAR